MSSSAQHPTQFNRFAGLPVPLVVTAQQAVHALQQQLPGRALRELERALSLAPAHPELLRLRGVALLQGGEIGRAVESLSEAVERWPDDALASSQLGVALAQSGDLGGAEALFLRSVELDPLLYDGWYNLAHALDRREDTCGACHAFERAVRLSPDDDDLRVLYAESLKMLGRLAEAEAELRGVIARTPDSISAWVGLSTLKTFVPSDAELDRLQALLESGQVPAARRIDFLFAVAALLDAGGRFAQAYPLFVAANAEKRRLVRWDAAAVSRMIDDVLATFAALPPVDERDGRGRDVVFFVGLPRSGSTLLEQMLCSHPDVQGGGERNDVLAVLQSESLRRGKPFPSWVADADEADWARLGKAFLARCARWRDGRPRFTNKALHNWQMVGAIRRMLPAATVVHCVRDPLETLWNCFRHHFGDAQLFAYDLDDLAAYRRDVERAMQAWKAHWPGRILTLVHEELLADPERRLRELLAHAGLEYHPACLAFHRNENAVRTSSAGQVRQPLRADLATAPRYGDLLAPLRARLAGSGPPSDPNENTAAS